MRQDSNWVTKSTYAHAHARSLYKTKLNTGKPCVVRGNSARFVLLSRPSPCCRRIWRNTRRSCLTWKWTKNVYKLQEVDWSSIMMSFFIVLSPLNCRARKVQGPISQSRLWLKSFFKDSYKAEIFYSIFLTGKEGYFKIFLLYLSTLRYSNVQENVMRVC